MVNSHCAQAQLAQRIAATARLCLVLGCAGLLGGCNFSTLVDYIPGKAGKLDIPAVAGPTKVVVDETALALNLPEQDVDIRRAFVAHYQTLLREDRSIAAWQWVERHPDLTLDVLREEGLESFEQDWLLEMAKNRDAQMTLLEGKGWEALISQRRKAPEVDAAYRKARLEFVAQLRGGRFENTARMDLVTPAQQGNHPFLLIDAWHLTGVGRMLAEQPREAVQALQQAFTLASQTDNHQAAYAGLLLSEAQRRAGEAPTANQTWQRTATLAARLLTQPHPVADPVLWERAAYLQPIGHAWPEATRASWQTLAAKPSLARTRDLQRIFASQADPEPVLLIWTSIASWRLERGEKQQALISFKKAETAASGATAQWLRMAQARALAGMDQANAATTILLDIASRKDGTPVCHAAMAELGSFRMQEGATAQGLSLLKQAVADEPRVDWPGRANSQADLALAYLILGQEDVGLRHLRQAKEAFKADADNAQLAQCLWNECRYWEETKNKSKLAEAQAELDAMRL